MKRAGVLFDGSPSSLRAVQEAVEVLGVGWELRVLTVLEAPNEEPPFGCAPPPPPHLALALALAPACFRRVTLLSSSLVLPSEIPGIVAARRQQAEEQQASLRALLSGWGQPSQLEVLVGDVRSLLVEWVAREGIRLLFLGTRSLNPLQAWLLGSTSLHALQHVPCPVCVVK